MLNLTDIVGQDIAINRLQRNMTAGRMHHAFLFTGLRGVGRRTTAQALAKLLLCHSPIEGPNNGQISGMADNDTVHLPCNQCNSCKTMDAGTNPDFQLIFKELARFHEDASVRTRVMQNLGIPVIQQFLIGPVGRASMGGKGKVFVVEEAELMTTEAQNALLKTLEEPPTGVTIILLSEKPESLLPTTRSRCSIVGFSPLPESFIIEKMTAEGIGESEAAFWARFTGGSLGVSLELSQAGMYDVKCEMMQQVAGLGQGNDSQLGDKWAKLSDSLAEAEVKRVKKQQDANLSKTLATRKAIGAMLQLLASAFQDAMSLSAGTGRPLVHADQTEAMTAIAQRLRPTQLAEVVEQLSRYEQLLWRNLNAKIIWDNVIITCASAAPLHV